MNERATATAAEAHSAITLPEKIIKVLSTNRSKCVGPIQQLVCSQLFFTSNNSHLYNLCVVGWADLVITRVVPLVGVVVGFLKK